LYVIKDRQHFVLFEQCVVTKDDTKKMQKDSTI